MTDLISTLPAERLDELRTLRVELQHHHGTLERPPGYVSRSDDDAWAAWRRSTQGLLASGEAELFVHGGSSGDPDGLALVTMLASARLLRPILQPEGVHAELVTLVVAAAARSDGIGAELYSAVAGWARQRGADTLHIGTRAGNVDGLRFYERQGARPAFVTLLHEL